MPTQTPNVPTARSIVFFDGDCIFCNRSVRTLLSLDDDETLAFAPLQGETAAALLPPELRNAEQLSTMALRRPDGRVFVRSAAVVEIMRQIGAPYSWAALLARAVPGRWRDAAYDLVARNRHRLIRSGACALPDPRDRDRMLP